jgi:hypothetical protein
MSRTGWKRHVPRSLTSPLPALALLALLAVLLAPAAAHAHKPSDSYLTLSLDAGAEADGRRWTGRWDVALRDLDLALELDRDGDGALTGAELRQGQPALAAHLLGALTLRAGGAPCALTASGHRLTEHSDGPYAVLDFQAACEREARPLEVGYALLFALDPQHRGLLRVVGEGGVAETGVFRSDVRALTLSPHVPASPWRAFAGMVREGVHHIFIGVDHVLFLLALLLPSVLRRREGRWEPAAGLWPVVAEVARVVTAFTVAHSVTLALSALGLVALPAREVETAIAVSVVLAALNNLWPVLPARWALAFALGLLHGFGFSSVLVDLGLPPGQLGLALLGFNVGVELGQLAIVGLFVPVAFWLRATALYRRGTLMGGSTAIALLAALWSFQRWTG